MVVQSEFRKEAGTPNSKSSRNERFDGTADLEIGAPKDETPTRAKARTGLVGKMMRFRDGILDLVGEFLADTVWWHGLPKTGLIE